LISLAKFEVLFNRQEPGSWAAVVGANVGANVHSRQATPGDVQPPLPQVNGTPGDMGYVRRLGEADLGAGGRGFESRHPDSFSNMLSIAGGQHGSRYLSLHVGRRGSTSAHVGSHQFAELTYYPVSRTCVRLAAKRPRVRGGAIPRF
jgi:hypothetical protein